MNILLACDNSSVLNTILFIKKLIGIIFIVAPIVLVLLLTIDIAKNVISKDDNENKRNVNIAIKRVVYCLLLFFVPLLIDGVMSYLDNYNVNFAKCYSDATEENVEKYYNEENKRYEEKEKEIEEERTTNASKIADEKLKEQEAAKAAAERAVKKLADAVKKTSEAISGLDLSGASTGAEKIALTAETLAWKEGTAKKVWYHHYYYNKAWKSWSELTGAKPTKAFMDAYDKVKPGHFSIPLNSKWGTKHSRIGASCDKFAGTVVRYSGYDKSFPDALGSSQNKRLANTDKWKKVSGSNAKRGAVCIKKSGTHILIYLGNGKVAHAGYGGIRTNSGSFGRVQKTSISGYNCWNPTK